MDQSDNEKDEKQKKSLTSLEKAFDIIESVKELDGAGVSELAKHLDIPKSTIHTHLSTLVNKGYLVEEESEYKIGLSFITLGRYSQDRPKFNLIRSKLEKISEETGERAQFMVVENGFGIYVFINTPPGGIEPGKWANERRTSLHASAAGKAILAHFNEEKIDKIINESGLVELTENAYTDRNKFLEELGDIRSQGFALNREEHVKGLHSVSVPILEPDDTVLGAISISAPAQRLTGERFEKEIPQMLIKVANEIELNIMNIEDEMNIN